MRSLFFMMRILLVLIIFQITLPAQDLNITGYLKRIERGEAESVKAEVKELLKANPDKPSVLFLDAILTEAGDVALKKYKTIYANYPDFAYADAVLYRIFSYYFSLGSYVTAGEYLSKLKSRFPNSAYLKVADRSIPEEEIEYPEKPVIENPTQKGKKEIKPLAQKLFTIQAGAFLNYSNATRLQENFRKNGYFSSVYPKEVGGSILNVVIVGKFKSKAEAQKFLKVLKTNFKTEGRIIPLKLQ